ncbi:glycosyltransferase family 4 protein [Enterobacter hormaechei]|uniref:glycosyltransferase family 4 protein n=1 Tax=Enterobacter hormaechei TaxID=158836 RepID=UPI0013D23AED|nr:glycosyltransferase family 4 protein [Enterobacter hormaechei]
MEKIVISANTSWYVFNFRKGTISELLKKGHEVIVITPKDGYENKLISMGCRHIEIDIDRAGRNIFKEMKTIIKYGMIYLKEKPSIILNFTPKANIYSSIGAWACKAKVINNISGLGAVFIKNNLLTKIVSLAYRVSNLATNTIFFQNDEDLHFFLKHKIVPQHKAKNIPGSGVNLEEFFVKPSPDDNKVRFLLVARLLKQKGVPEYIEAATILQKKYSNVEFAILGPIDHNNPNSIDEKNLIECNSRHIINYLGTSDDVASIVEHYDCVVLPSYYREGVPRSLLEAAAMGKPLIATDNVGCRDVVFDGVNGFLCEKKNPVSLAEAMEKVINVNHQERLSLGLEGRKIIEKIFDERIVINKYMQIINGVG